MKGDLAGEKTSTEWDPARFHSSNDSCFPTDTDHAGKGTTVYTAVRRAGAGASSREGKSIKNGSQEVVVWDVIHPTKVALRNLGQLPA